MSQIVNTVPISHRDVNLDWMVGCDVCDVAFHEPSLWTFSLGHGRGFTVECLWRIIAASVLTLTSEDHRQQFGLGAPLDAQHEASKLLIGRPITSVRLDKATSDLAFEFGSDLKLEITATSSGYENWQIFDSTGVNYVAGGEGNISTWRS